MALKNGTSLLISLWLKYLNPISASINLWLTSKKHRGQCSHNAVEGVLHENPNTKVWTADWKVSASWSSLSQGETWISGYWNSFFFFPSLKISSYSLVHLYIHSPQNRHTESIIPGISIHFVGAGLAAACTSLTICQSFSLVGEPTEKQPTVRWQISCHCFCGASGKKNQQTCQKTAAPFFKAANGQKNNTLCETICFRFPGPSCKSNERHWINNPFKHEVG